MSIHDVSLHDWLTLAVAIGGLLWGWAQGKGRLPKAVRRYIDKLGGIDRFVSLCAEAAAFTAYTPEQRRAKVIERLQQIARIKLGFELPDSIVNIIVEYAYQVYRRTVRK